MMITYTMFDTVKNAMHILDIGSDNYRYLTQIPSYVELVMCPTSIGLS